MISIDKVYNTITIRIYNPKIRIYKKSITWVTVHIGRHGDVVEQHHYFPEDIIKKIKRWYFWKFQCRNMQERLNEELAKVKEKYPDLSKMDTVRKTINNSFR